MVDSFGIASTSSPIRFPMSSNPPEIVTPVMLPSGRAMLATSPRAIGSLIIDTIGIVVVAILKSGLSLQIALYAESLQLHWLTVHWFKTTLPWIVAIGLTVSLMVGVVTETVRLIGGP